MWNYKGYPIPALLQLLILKVYIDILKNLSYGRYTVYQRDPTHGIRSTGHSLLSDIKITRSHRYKLLNEM